MRQLHAPFLSCPTPTPLRPPCPPPLWLRVPQVLRSGTNLLDKVEELEAAAAAQQAVLAQQRAAAAAREARLAELEQAASALEGRYSSVQVLQPPGAVQQRAGGTAAVPSPTHAVVMRTQAPLPSDSGKPMAVPHPHAASDGCLSLVALALLLLRRRRLRPSGRACSASPLRRRRRARRRPPWRQSARQSGSACWTTCGG